MEDMKIVKTISILGSENTKVKEANINFSKFVSWAIKEKLDSYKKEVLE